MALSRSSAAILLGALVASCTLTRQDVVACSARDCEVAFGAGFACGASGLCERSAASNKRCTKTFPTDLLKSSDAQRIPIGVLMDRSEEAQRGREDAIQLAAQQVNDAQGLSGRSFGIVFCDIAKSDAYDSLSVSAAAVGAAQYLADFGVPAIIGPSSSTDALAVFDAVNDASKSRSALVMTPSSTSPRLTGHDVREGSDQTPGLLWRTAIPDTVQGPAIARYLNDTFPDDKSAVVLHDSGPYGLALKAAFTARFEGNGGTVTAIQFTPDQRDKAFVDAPQSAPKVVVLFSSLTEDAIAFVNAVNTNAAAYASARIVVTDTAAKSDFLTAVAGASSVFPRILGSRPAFPAGTTFTQFKSSYSAAFGKDLTGLTFVPHAYDAAWLVFFGVAWSAQQEQSITPLGIAKGLRHLSTPAAVDSLSIGAANTWTTIVNAFSTGTEVNVVGASGSLEYDPVTEEASGLIDIWKIGASGTSLESVGQVAPR